MTPWPTWTVILGGDLKSGWAMPLPTQPTEAATAAAVQQQWQAQWREGAVAVAVQYLPMATRFSDEKIAMGSAVMRTDA